MHSEVRQKCAKNSARPTGCAMFCLSLFLRFPFHVFALSFSLFPRMCVFCCVPHSAACLLAEKCNEVPHGVKGAARERAG